MITKGLIVVKYGSETVTNVNGVDKKRIGRHARKLSRLPNELLVVSSGAVRAGQMEAPEIKDDQILAGMGSAEVVMAWKQAFRRFGRYAAQVPVTDHEISDEEEGEIFFNSLRKCLDARVVPIINTNDMLSNEELPKRKWKGENDGPAAHIAQVMGASALLLLTERNGVFDEEHITIDEVPDDAIIRANLLEMVKSRTGRESSDSPLQGIVAKVMAANSAAELGIHAYIAGADENIEAILAGETGTHFVAAA